MKKSIIIVTEEKEGDATTITTESLGDKMTQRMEEALLNDLIKHRLVYITGVQFGIRNKGMLRSLLRAFKN